MLRAIRGDLWVDISIADERSRYTWAYTILAWCDILTKERQREKFVSMWMGYDPLELHTIRTSSTAFLARMVERSETLVTRAFVDDVCDARYAKERKVDPSRLLMRPPVALSTGTIIRAGWVVFHGVHERDELDVDARFEDL